MCILIVAACTERILAPNDGPASPAQSVVTVSRDTVFSGAAVSLKLETKDAEGRRLNVGGAAVVFEVNGGTSTGTIDPVNDHGDGTYTALFTGVVAGTATTVGATIDGVAVTQPLPTIRVLPGPVSPTVSSVRVTPATITVGETATIELITKDAQGNQLSQGGKQVSFLLGNGTSGGTLGPVTDHSDGSYTAEFTATSRGTPLAVGALVDGSPVTTAPPTLTVAAGVSPDSSFINISSDTVTIGAGVTVTLRVVDSTGLARTSGGETVVFSVIAGGGGQGSIDSTTDHDNGSYTATFTASGVGPVEIAATIGGRPVSGRASIDVLARPIALQKSSVEVSEDAVGAGGIVQLTLIVRDLDSNQVTTGGLAVVFTTSDGLSTGSIGPATDHNDGSYTASFTGRRAGTPTTIGATVNDSTQIQMLDTLGVSHLPTITVVPAAASVDSTLFTVIPSSITIGDSTQLALEVRDAFGNPVGQGGSTVSFARLGGAGRSVGTIGSVTDHGDGTYSAFYRADSAGTADSVTATLDGVPLPHRLGILVACVAGPVSFTVSELSISDAMLASGVGTTLTLRIRDAVGCPITTPHGVTLAAVGGTSTGVFGPVFDQGDGTYTATFTGVLAGTATAISATIDGTVVTSPPAGVTVIPGDISPQTSIISVAPAQVDSGAHSITTLQARDAAGNDLVNGGRLVILSLSGSPLHGTLSATADLGDGRYTAVYTGTLVAPGSPDLVVASIEGTAVSTPSPGVEVVAGTISPDQSLVTVSAGTVVVGDSVLVTLVGMDAAGRALVSGDRSDPIAFSLTGGTSVATFGPVQNNGDGSYAVWLLGVQAGTPSTIEVTISGNLVTTSLPSVEVTP